jgi:hypothetical protein
MPALVGFVPTFVDAAIAQFVKHLRRMRILLDVVLNAHATCHVLQDFERASCSLAL